MDDIKIITTSDQSHSLYVPGLDEHYHSIHGAVQESVHVFIEAGLHQVIQQKISVLEVGFGTGLNAFLSFLSAQKSLTTIHYTTVERYPLPKELFGKLNYGALLSNGMYCDEFMALHEVPWETWNEIHSRFYLKKCKDDIREVTLEDTFDLIYFDAFAPSKQPFLWTKEIFSLLVNAMKKESVITTYAATGMVRRLWQDLGLRVERLPGPPGKREMLRGHKPS